MYQPIIKLCRGFLESEEEMTKKYGTAWSLGAACGHLKFIADILEQEIQDNAQA